jgi:hypothetical protein
LFKLVALLGESIIAAAMGKAARGALSPTSLAKAREEGRAKYARASMKAAAKGTTLSKQRPVEYHMNQNASRAGRSVKQNGVQRTLLLQPKPLTAEEREAVALDKWPVAHCRAQGRRG